MIEFDSKIKLGDNDTANVTATYYCINQNAFLWEVKLTEDKKTFTLQEYLKEVHTAALNYTRMTFSKYTYGFNKAFAGQEVVCVEGKVISNDIYSNYNYPMQPPGQTDFGNAHSKANYLIRFFNSFTLLPEFNDFEFNGEKFVVEDYVTRSFELYEDSVIFTQTAPFIMNRFSFSDAAKYAFYTGCISDNCEITQTVKFDLKTKQIELVEVKGNTRSSVILPNCSLEVDIRAKVMTLDTAKFEEVANELVEYVKKNSNT